MINQDEFDSVGDVVRLGAKWVAVVKPDGSVTLQHLSSVCVGGSGEIVDMIDPTKPIASINYFLENMDAERLAVRTMELLPDGSVLADPNAMSPSGLLSDEAFEVFPSTQHSSSYYFKRKGNQTDW